MRDFSRKYSRKFKSNLKSSSWTPWRHATTLLRSFFKKVNKLCFLRSQSHGNSTYETPSSNFSINISSTHWSNSVENLKVIAIKRKNDFIIRYGNNRLPPSPPADSISSKKNPRKVFSVWRFDWQKVIPSNYFPTKIQPVVRLGAFSAIEKTNCWIIAAMNAHKIAGMKLDGN